jgi:hypothetical protein
MIRVIILNNFSLYLIIHQFSSSFIIQYQRPTYVNFIHHSQFRNSIIKIFFKMMILEYYWDYNIIIKSFFIR